MLVNGGFNDYCGRKANLMKLLDAMQIKEKCKKVKDKAIGNYSFSTSKLANTKAGKNIWHNYHTNKKLASNVSCESK